MKKKAILTIYLDGSMERDAMSAGELRSIGQQLIAMADNVIIRATPEQNGQEPEVADVEAVVSD